ncbi:hypothetical protein DFP73DRAFT_140964 [Morchella snyderi]|nr:hypothetical protein DFP73DRAFT_140964 [Morchella snyderi]
METTGHSQPTFASPDSSDHAENKLYCAGRYHAEEEIYIAGTTFEFASNRLEMSADSAFEPRIWALLAFWSFLMANIRGHFHMWKRVSHTLVPLIAAVGCTSLYRFFFAGHGSITMVTLMAIPYMSLGGSRLEGKCTASVPVLMMVDEVLAVGGITSLPLDSSRGKDVILAGTRFRLPSGITVSQRCLDPTRFNTAPPFQSPNQKSSHPLLQFSAYPPSTTTRKETTQLRTLKSQKHARKRRNYGYYRWFPFLSAPPIII